MDAVLPLTRKYASTCFSTTPRNHFCKENIRRLISFEFHADNSTRAKNNKITTKCFKVRTYRLNKDTLCPLYYASKSSEGGDDIISEAEDQCRQAQASKGLESLERYIAILKEDTKSEDGLQFTTNKKPSRMTEDSTVTYQNVTELRRDYTRESSQSSSLFTVKDGANLYLIILISMNIAVFLFEIASPIKNSDNNLWSLPLMYGAKVNDLIMLGEWWRLLTPMFLHAGLLHVGLSSWALLSFGPQVCKGYGAFTFFLIFVLGGISGNFTSFLHTSDPTVGGSGPVFAVIGAWLVYQAQNKDVSGKQNFESMFQKAVIATTFSFVLANFGPIDNWTNLGAAISGIIYGYLASPVVEIDDASSSACSDGIGNRMKEEITLRRNPASPCKSLLIFTLFVSALTSLLLFVESPLDSLELEELVQITESPF
ncbi:RHOMBOID-like protein 9, chloroplastic isoform X2 [Silene latifolia]|uniref:RHOMBOID-like protein 9, chloroplastic isoform X2 n=1 Tax=Silene latifolia TaxID=37657 RepID=UPI003D76DEE1